MVPFIFQRTFCNILISGEIQVIMTSPWWTVAEDDSRDTIVALSHDKVCKAGNLIHNGFFGYLEHMPEQVGITPEIAYRTKTAPPDCIAGLPATE